LCFLLRFTSFVTNLRIYVANSYILNRFKKNYDFSCFCSSWVFAGVRGSSRVFAGCSLVFAGFRGLPLACPLVFACLRGFSRGVWILDEKLACKKNSNSNLNFAVFYNTVQFLCLFNKICVLIVHFGHWQAPFPLKCRMRWAIKQNMGDNAILFQNVKDCLVFWQGKQKKHFVTIFKYTCAKKGTESESLHQNCSLHWQNIIAVAWF